MIEKIVNDLQKIFLFKETTQVGDVVLIVAEGIMYAMVTGIERDYGKKDEWWQVSMQLLTIPPQKTAWTLRTPQFTGQEIFTMGGEPRFVKALDFGGDDTASVEKDERPVPKEKKKSFLKVIK